MICSIENCDRASEKRSWCNMHYRRWRRHGDPTKLVRMIGKNRKKHPLYTTYLLMLDRCRNRNNASYEDYGGRGIKVCDRWKGIDGFDNFVADMGERPLGKTLDRRDNDGNYEPSNCRWATKFQQASNRRTFKNNKSGFPGITWNKEYNKWRVRKQHEGRMLFVGAFSDLNDAIQALGWVDVNDKVA